VINAPIFLSTIDNQNFVGTDAGASEGRDDCFKRMGGELVTGANAKTHRRWWQHDFPRVPSV
jgi:hypothetical protein